MGALEGFRTGSVSLLSDKSSIDEREEDHCSAGGDLQAWRSDEVICSISDKLPWPGRSKGRETLVRSPIWELGTGCTACWRRGEGQGERCREGVAGVLTGISVLSSVTRYENLVPLAKMQANMAKSAGLKMRIRTEVPSSPLPPSLLSVFALLVLLSCWTSLSFSLVSSLLPAPCVEGRGAQDFYPHPMIPRQGIAEAVKEARASGVIGSSTVVIPRRARVMMCPCYIPPQTELLRCPMEDVIWDGRVERKRKRREERRTGEEHGKNKERPNCEQGLGEEEKTEGKEHFPPGHSAVSFCRFCPEEAESIYLKRMRHTPYAEPCPAFTFDFHADVSSNKSRAEQSRAEEGEKRRQGEGRVAREWGRRKGGKTEDSGGERGEERRGEGARIGKRSDFTAS
eukprot:761301-Hanusia_phi.AAC.1